MALTPVETALIQAKIGPLGLDDVSEAGNVATLVEGLGSLTAAALAVSLTRYNEMAATPASTSSAGQGSSNHTANLEAMRGSVDALVGELSADPSELSEDGVALLASARAAVSPGAGFGTVEIVMNNRRPG